MTRQPRLSSDSGIHHVIWRGINRDPIFVEDADRVRFLECLEAVKPISGCRVLAYCLMTNHVHLLLRTGTEPIGEVLRRLGVRYAGWFNRKYGRVGHVFQDRFTSKPVDTDAYLATVLRYIWNNPVQARLVVRPEDYPWSSRRFLDGDGSTVVDDAELRTLIDVNALREIAASDPQLLASPADRRSPALRGTDAATLLRRASGATSPESFQALDAHAQQAAIAQLRTRGVSYRQLALVTGLSATTVWRLHSGGSTAPRTRTA